MRARYCNTLIPIVTHHGIGIPLVAALAVQIVQCLGRPLIERATHENGMALTYEVESGCRSQLQKSEDLTKWVDEGVSIRSKSVETLRFPLLSNGQEMAFYRFLRMRDFGSPEEWVAGGIGTKLIDSSELSREASSLSSILSSKAFVYLTGTLEQAYHEPVGEVANYIGFAALRNEIRERHGRLADQGIRGYFPLRSGESVDHEALVEAYAETAGIGETQRGIIEALTFAVLESQISEEQLSYLREGRALSEADRE